MNVLHPINFNDQLSSIFDFITIMVVIRMNHISSLKIFLSRTLIIFQIGNIIHVQYFFKLKKKKLKKCIFFFKIFIQRLLLLLV